jgi:hypothetical protein
MELAHEFDFHADMGTPLMPGNGPRGTRIIGIVAGGWVKGDRINGVLAGPGADWALLGAVGWSEIDVRAQIQTVDGAVLYMTYTGVLETNEKVMAAFMGGPETAFDDHYFRTTPRLETGDARYLWVNHTIFVARGRLVPGAVEYEVYRII